MIIIWLKHELVPTYPKRAIIRRVMEELERDISIYNIVNQEAK
jgi:hypothetical protein